jgi:hypothetical protein
MKAEIRWYIYKPKDIKDCQQPTKCQGRGLEQTPTQSSEETNLVDTP